MQYNQKLGDVTGSILAGMLILESLQNLVPNGMILYLIYLVLGTVIVTNKLNRIIREKQGNEESEESEEWYQQRLRD